MQNVWLWCARLAWAALPITTGSAIAGALDDWSSALAAAVLLWGAWGIGLVALFAPRTWGLTTIRVVAPVAVVVTIIATPASSSAAAVIATVSSLLAAALVLAPPFAIAAANALAYGDEHRFPLRIPIAQLLTLVPISIALVAVGIAAGPLLAASGNVVLGIVALVVGLPVAGFFARALHGLSRRWLVLVPAGVVIVDPLILVDPALMRREQVESLAATTPDPAFEHALDLRLGTHSSSVTITLRAPFTFSRRAGRTGGALVETDVVLVAPTRRADVLRLAAARRLAPRP
jgi:hypothetical protein